MSETVSPAVRATSAQGRYEQLSASRGPFLRRAEEASRLTIPTLLPPEGSNGSTKLPEPFQSVGARGVNHLAAKILLALFPPGSSFFKLQLDDFVVQKLAERAGNGAEGEDARAKFDAALARVERAVVNRMEQTGARAPLYDAIRHLLVGGNVLIQEMGKGVLRCHYFHNFVVKRDGEGAVLEIIVKETLARMSLPEAAQAVVTAQHKNESDTNEATINLYTHVRLVGNKWDAYQEVCNTRIPGTEGSYPKTACPFIPLRFSRIDGEDYGRSMVEEIIGDLRSLESLSQSIVEFAAIAAKILFLVDPTGTTKKQTIARARNGGVENGNAKDVTVLGLEKFADFRVAKETKSEIEQRLGEAFLLGSAVRRDAERVTAEEIRVIAAELEESLGGFYSVLSTELQLPLVSRLLYAMQRDRSLPPLPREAVKPSIVTGMEALGRGSELAKMERLLTSLGQMFGQEAVAEAVKVNAYMLRGATALGIDIEGLVRSDDEIEAARKQKVAQSMVEKLGPKAMGAMNEQQQTA